MRSKSSRATLSHADRPCVGGEHATGVGISRTWLLPVSSVLFQLRCGRLGGAGSRGETSGDLGFCGRGAGPAVTRPLSRMGPVVVHDAGTPEPMLLLGRQTRRPRQRLWASRFVNDSAAF